MTQTKARIRCKNQNCMNYVKDTLLVCSNCSAKYKRNRQRRQESYQLAMQYQDTALNESWEYD